MTDTVEMLKIRNRMKDIMREFNETTKIKSREATEFNRRRIIGELKVVADQFAEQYNDLQLTYLKLMFFQDLEEVIGKRRASLVFIQAQVPQILQDLNGNNY